MGHKDAVPDFVEQGGNGVYRQPGGFGPYVRRALPEKLFKRIPVFWELHAFVKVRPSAQPENGKPRLFVANGPDFGGGHSAAGRASSGLVHEVNPVAALQENVLEAVAAVRSAFPGLFRLPVAVEEYHRVFFAPSGIW